MFYVYLLKSKQSDKIHTGFTSDLRRRVKEHLQKNVHTTKRMGEIELVFYEAFVDENDAKEREKYLKTTKGKRTVRLMLKHSLTKAPVV